MWMQAQTALAARRAAAIRCSPQIQLRLLFSARPFRLPGDVFWPLENLVPCQLRSKPELGLEMCPCPATHHSPKPPWFFYGAFLPHTTYSGHVCVWQKGLAYVQLQGIELNTAKICSLQEQAMLGEVLFIFSLKIHSGMQFLQFISPVKCFDEASLQNQCWAGMVLPVRTSGEIFACSSLSWHM